MLRARNSRRRMQLSLSDRGQKVMDRVRGNIDERLRIAFARMDPTEQQELMRFLPLFGRFLEGM